MASRFRHYGLPMSDLVQEGCVGLMQAAARFEPEREVRFSTYASVVDPLGDAGFRSAQLVDRAHRHDVGAEVALLQPAPSARPHRRCRRGHLSAEARARVAHALGVPEHDVEAMAARLSAPDRSLNAPLTDEGDGEWQDLLADEGADPEAEIMLRAR